MNNTEMFLHIPRIYTAVAQWLAISVYIYFSTKRFNKKKTIFIAVIFLAAFIGFHYWADSWHINLWILGMIISVLLMYTYLYTTTNTNYKVTGFNTVVAFVIAELVASLEWQVEYFMITNNFMNFFTKSFIKNHHLRFSLMFIAMYSGLFSVVFAIEKRFFNEKKINVRSVDLVTVLIIGVLVFTISNISFLNINTPITSGHTFEIFYIRTLVNLTGIFLIYTHREHKFSNEKRLEINNMEKLLEKQYENYQLSETQANLINQKYHDLKHYISIIKSESNINKKMEYVDDLDKSIADFYYNFKTGNNVLDIILFSKQDVFKENDITFTCVVDGKLLEEFNISDIISIFSNLLDNAIESVKLIDDIDKRLINLAVFKDDDFLVIRFENYFEHTLKYEYGDLLSTKGQKDIRGFGIKSIRATVENHEGNFKILTSNNWFKTLILLPIRNNTSKLGDDEL